MSNNYHNTQNYTFLANKRDPSPSPGTPGVKPLQPVKFEDVNISTKVKDGLG